MYSLFIRFKIKTERFIREIENIRNMWDITSILYRDRAKREFNWRIIGKKLHNNWNELREMERLLLSK